MGEDKMRLKNSSRSFALWLTLPFLPFYLSDHFRKYILNLKSFWRCLQLTTVPWQTKGQFSSELWRQIYRKKHFRNIISIPTRIKWECVLLSSDFDNVIYHLTVEEKEAHGAQTPSRSMDVNLRSCLWKTSQFYT